MHGHLPAGLVGCNGREVAGPPGLPVHEVRGTAQCLNDVVVGRQSRVSPAFAEAVQSDEDQARVAGTQDLRRQSQLGEFLRPHVVDEHIGRVGQREQGFARSGLLEVQHDAALVAVDPEKQRRHAVFMGRSGIARAVALGGLDLDDVGAIVGQRLRRVRAEHDRREIDHAHAAQGGIWRRRWVHVFIQEVLLPAMSRCPAARRHHRRWSRRLPNGGRARLLFACRVR